MSRLGFPSGIAFGILFYLYAQYTGLAGPFGRKLLEHQHDLGWGVPII
jgi:hypothetical protein